MYGNHNDDNDNNGHEAAVVHGEKDDDVDIDDCHYDTTTTEMIT